MAVSRTPKGNLLFSGKLSVYEEQLLYKRINAGRGSNIICISYWCTKNRYGDGSCGRITICVANLIFKGIKASTSALQITKYWTKRTRN